MVFRWICSLLAAGCVPLMCQAGELPESIARWEKDISKFTEEISKKPPQAGQIVFVGSSSIRLWDLEKSFPKLVIYNRGFGGSRLEDSVHYADRIILPYRPRTVVLYAGDNDVAAGYTPAAVLEDFQEFVARIRQELPDTKIVYIAIKPSLKRWNLIDTIRQTNSLIAQECQKTDRCEFVDIDTPMIGEDGKPSEEFFVKDGLHLSDKGYALWTKKVAMHLKSDEPESDK